MILVLPYRAVTCKRLSFFPWQAADFLSYTCDSSRPPVASSTLDGRAQLPFKMPDKHKLESFFPRLPVFRPVSQYLPDIVARVSPFFHPVSFHPS